MKKICSLAAGVIAALLANSANGEDHIGSIPQKQYVVAVGAGGQLKNEYPGSSDYILSPFPIVQMKRLYIPGLGQVVDGTKRNGFSAYPAFNIQGKREATDSAILTGTRNIDYAIEFGAGFRARHEWIEGFVEFRQGFKGHDGQTGEVGIDFVTQPSERLQLTFGPRMDWGSDEFMGTYFGVTQGEAVASGSRLTAYNPDGGIVSLGLVARAEYALTERTTLHLRAGWDRFVGDAADSPIVRAGDENQLTMGAGISYLLDFDLFD